LSTFERHGYAIAHVVRRAYDGAAVAARHPIADVRAPGELDDEHLDREPRSSAAWSPHRRYAT
jgi:hypothetical protein